MSEPSLGWRHWSPRASLLCAVLWVGCEPQTQQPADFVPPTQHPAEPRAASKPHAGTPVSADGKTTLPVPTAATSPRPIQEHGTPKATPPKGRAAAGFEDNAAETVRSPEVSPDIRACCSQLAQDAPGSVMPGALYWRRAIIVCNSMAAEGQSAVQVKQGVQRALDLRPLPSRCAALAGHRQR